MARPGNGHVPLPGQVWAADTGLYGSYGRHYTDEGYLAWLSSKPRETCLFATAPDVVGDAAATLALSGPMFRPIRDLGYRVALVAQDGLEALEIPWDEFDALFIGGSTAWKVSEEARRIAIEARRRGKWVHMGRVNSYRRMIVAQAFGCDSVDGTYLRFAADSGVADIEDWTRRIVHHSSLWSMEGNDD